MKSKIFTLIFLALISVNAFTDDYTVVSAVPLIMISENGMNRITRSFGGDEMYERRCIVTESDGKYFWTSRENIKMMKTVSGAFTTYVAVNGSGYVRVVDPQIKLEMSKDEGMRMEYNYGYIEHIVNLLSTITYFGRQEQ